MNSSTSLETVKATIRSRIKAILSLSDEYIREVVYLYGTELSIYNQETSSLEPYDINDEHPLVLYELLSRNSDNNVDYDDSGKDVHYQAYTFSISMYGYASMLAINKLKAKLLSEDVVYDLQAKAIYVEHVHFPEVSYENINEVFWPRNDVNIDIVVKFEYASETSYDISVMSSLDITTL